MQSLIPSPILFEDKKVRSSENGLEFNNQHVFFTSSENMEDIIDESIDVIVTSPPYNRKKNYQGDNGESYNDALPEGEYLSFLTRVWTECFKKATSKCVFFLNIGDSATDQGISEKVATTMEDAGWTRIQDIIWAKSIYGMGHYTPSGGDKRLNNIWEHIFLFAKNKKTYRLDPKAIGIPFADKSNIGRYGDSDLRDAGNLFHVTYDQTTGATIKKGHEAPYPIGLPYKCIKLVPDAQRVLDPFLGTGTTLAAAANLGKMGYGYEKYPLKDLILQTIQSGLDYTPRPPILIPHYESAIKTLLRVMNASVQGKCIQSSQKFTIDLEILRDTLTKMGLDERMYQNLKSHYLPHLQQ